MLHRFLLGLIFSAAVASGGVGILQTESVERQVPGDRIQNVILISLDTVRWDVISAYNAPEANSPNIGALAREGVVFENTYSPAPVTLPSHATMLTGKFPPAHGVLDNGRYVLAPDHLTLAEILKKGGFNTGAFVSALVLDSDFGLDQGFDHYDDSIESSAIIGERRGDMTTARAVDWISKRKMEKNFVFLHLFDPHAPYESPEPFKSKIKSLYHGYPDYIQDYIAEVAFVDHCVGFLVQKLKDLGLYESSLICITSDHGESHGEHGENTHGFFIYSSTTRVPLIIKSPGLRRSSRVEVPVGIVDVLPTICGLLNIDIPSEIQGKNLQEFMSEEMSSSADRSLLLMSVEPTKYGGNNLFGIVGYGYKYIDAERPELYQLDRDVYEKDNVAKKNQERAKKMHHELQSILGEYPLEGYDGSRRIDAATRERLEALGYVTSLPAEDRRMIDPKDLIEYHKKNLVALTYVAPENRTAALAACDDMIRMRPNFHLGYQMKATVLVAAGRSEDASRFFEKAKSLRSGETH